MRLLTFWTISLTAILLCLAAFMRYANLGPPNLVLLGDSIIDQMRLVQPSLPQPSACDKPGRQRGSRGANF